MPSFPRFLAAEPWRNKDLYLYHGTIDIHAKSIRKKVLLERGSPNADFGRGFYTTTVRRQARAWAWQLALDSRSIRSETVFEAKPVVVSFQVNRDHLARLQPLVFVRGDHLAEEYWSLVHYCRSGGAGHQRQTYPEIGEWYDVVVGPVAAVWRTRLAISNSDPFSFHTQAAAELLNGSPKRVETVRVA